MTTRKNTRSFKINNLNFGGNEHIYIQSMCNTKTKDISATVAQILELEKLGCEIIRVAVLDKEDAFCISEIKKQINIPLVADIHFDPELAIIAINQGIDKIRLNPGNISDKEKIKEIVTLCKEKNIPIRIGVNGGSLPKDIQNSTPENMIEAAKRHISILEELNFKNICLSLKSSDLDTTIKAYELASKVFDYPLHVGITEAGTSFKGLIKSSIGIAKILDLGIGNAIRVSLTDDPKYEVIAAKEILNNLHYIDNAATLTSCPTCGRTQVNMIPIAKKLKLI